MINHNYLHAASEFLDRHVAVHNEVFGFSIRKILPIPLIFKKQDFAYLWAESDEIYHELGRLISEVEGNVLTLERDSIFVEYLKALELASKNLSIINKRLSQKANKLAEYSKTEYDKDCDNYQASRISYSNLGAALNEHLLKKI